MRESQSRPLELSSFGTELYRIAGAGLVLAVLLVTLLMFIAPDLFESGDPGRDRWFWLGGTAIWGAILHWCFLPLRSVALRSNALLVWRHGKQLEIPLSNVERVQESSFLSPGIVWVHFRHPTELGSKLAFLPAWRWQPPGAVQHPVVGELRKRLRAASSERAGGDRR